MLWGYLETNFPRMVYYYGPTVLWDNVVPLIMWMCIADVCNFITGQLCLGSLRSIMIVICAHVPMSLRVRTAVPDLWSGNKVVKRCGSDFLRC